MIFNIIPVRTRVVPELDPGFPADMEAAFPYGGGTAVLQVKIARQGFPRNYHYRWFVDGEEVPGSDSPVFSLAVDTNGTHAVFCQVSNGLEQQVRSRTAVVTARAARQYLYRQGEEFASITGLWAALASGTSFYDAYFGAAQKQQEQLYLTAKIDQCYGGRCVTEKALDLRNYTKLCFDAYAWGKVTAALASGQQEKDILLHKASTPYNLTTGWSGILELDITDLDSGYPMALAGPAQSSDCYAEIHSVWLE